MMDNKNNKHSPAFDLEALTKAYEQSLNDVTLGGKDIPTPEARRTARNTKPVGELKSFVPEDFSPMNEGAPEHDKIVDKIREDRRKRSHSIWTDSPLLKPKKSVWIDGEDEPEETQQTPVTQPVYTAPAQPVPPVQPQAPEKRQLPPDFVAPLPVMTQPPKPAPVPDFEKVVDAAMGVTHKQELLMNVDSRGDTRVREVPHRAGRLKAEDSPNKRTVSLKMPISKMNLDDLRDPIPEKKPEAPAKAETPAVTEKVQPAETVQLTELEKTAEFSVVKEKAEKIETEKFSAAAEKAAVSARPSAEIPAEVKRPVAAKPTEKSPAAEVPAAAPVRRKSVPAEVPAEKQMTDEAYDFAEMIHKVRSGKKDKPLDEFGKGSTAAPKKKTSSKRKKTKTHELEFHFINSIMCVGMVFAIFFSLLFMERESGFINSENRNLAEFPSFSIKDYFAGKYTRAIDDYFTDTIPGREDLKKFGAMYDRLKGIDLGGAKVNGSHKVAEKETLDEEKRVAVTTVTANTDPKAVTTTKAKDKDGKKTTTKKEEVVKLPEILDDGVLEGDVIVFGKGKDVRAVAGYYGMFETGALYAKTINKYKEEMPEVNVYNMTIPTSAAYYMPKNFKDIVADQKDNIDNIASELSGIINVDVYDAIGAHTDEYIYSRTDHHWQPLGAYYAGKVFAEKAGVKYADLKTYEKNKIDGFLGTMYAYSNYDSELEANPDTFIYYKPDNEYTTKYYNTDFTNGEESSLFFDYAEGVNCYSAIMGKDEEITEITTDVGNGRTLVIFKDSFGNALVPFLTHSFEKIYVCDFRYFDENAIEFCRAVGCTDLLFSISITSCSTEMHITAINNNRVQDSAVPLEIQSDEPEESQPEEKPDENESKPDEGNPENNDNTDNADGNYED
jgi:hypothetical protein